MFRRLFTLIFALLIFALSKAKATNFNGYLKTANSHNQLENGISAIDSWLNEGAFTLTKEFNDFFFEGALQVQSVTSNGAITKSYHYRVDPNPEPAINQVYTQTKELVFLNLNRLNLEYRHEKIQIDVGRQALTLGISKISSPLQLVNPLNILNYDLEQLDGVDAAVFKSQISESLFLRVGTLGGSENLSFLEAKKSFNQFNFSAYFMQYQKSPLLGIGVSTNIGGAGLYAEVTSMEDRDIQLKNELHATLGADYQFQNTFYFDFELIYNGSGSANHNPIAQFWFRPFKNQNYLLNRFSYELTPILILSLNSYYNIFDSSIFELLKLDYNFAENFYFVLDGGVSDKTQTAAQTLTLTQPEFSTLPDFFYVGLKYFF